MSSCRVALVATVAVFGVVFFSTSQAHACAYCSIPVIGGCCGGPGEIVCGVVGCKACMPGTHYDASTAHCEYDCSWHTSSFGNCCGDVGQVVCDSSPACKPGLFYNAGTTHCEVNNCSYGHSTFGNCCGDVGQVICDPLSGYSACKSGLHYDGSTTHCELPCSFGTSSFGNCCGDVGQVHCDVLSGYSACRSDLATGIFTCQYYREVGQTCGPDYPCADGTSCTMVVDGGLKLECVLDSTANLVTDPDVCRAFYSSDVAQGAKNGGIVLSFGVGAQANAGVGGSIETGLFYTPNDQYGCYQTTCVGIEVNLGIAVYVVAGQTDTYEHFKGHSFVLNESAGIDVVNYITTQGWQSKEEMVSGVAPSSTSQAVDFGLEILPIAAGAAECDTIVQLVVGEDTPTKPVAKCKNVSVIPPAGSCVASASIDDGSYVTTTGATLATSQVPAGPYPIGYSYPTLTVTDSSSLTATCTATVSVLDVVPPAITCPASVTVPNAAGRCSAPVTYSDPSASDLCSGFNVYNTPASGTTFPVGDGVVTGTAFDEVRNTSTCTFHVNVIDNEVPSFTFVPADQVVNATMPSGAVVTYAPFLAADNCGVQSVTSAPASGSVFPINDSPSGVTTVTAVATDLYSNLSSAAFAVHVKGALEQLDDLLRRLDGIRHHHDLEEELMHAVHGVVRGHVHDSCESLRDFIEKVGSHEYARRLSPAQVSSFTADAIRIGAVLDCRAHLEDDDEQPEPKELARR